MKTACFAAAVLLSALAPLAATATPTVSCHCFKNRDFDRGQPAAADPYLLATTENSLLAGAFSLSKGAVVRARMTGTSREDLWVAHGVGQATGPSADDLLHARAEGASWKKVLEGAGIEPAELPPHLADPLEAGADPEALARAVVDHTLVSRLGADPRRVAALHALGASDRETAAAVLLTLLGDEDGLEAYGRVKAGSTTWGALFHAIGLTPKEVGRKIGALAASGPP